MQGLAHLIAGAALALAPSTFGAVILSDDVTAPSSNVIVSNSSNTSFLRLLPNANGTTADDGRGQTFLLPDAGPSASAWSVSGLTLQKNGTQTTGAGSKLFLWVFEYNPSTDANASVPWSGGDGTGDGNPLDGTGVGTLLVNKAEFAIGGKSYADGRYLHVSFTEPLTLNESKVYGFYAEFTGSIASAVAPASTSRFQLSSPSNTASSYANGVMLTTTPGANGVNADQDYSFHVIGTPVPEPSATAALLLPVAGLLSRRRRRTKSDLADEADRSR